METNGGGSTNGDIGRRVQALMDAQQITQGQLAAYLGITQSAASRKLAGGRPWYPQEIQATARLLGVSVGVLFGEPEGACLAGELALTA